MQSLKYFFFLIFIFSSRSAFSQEITLIWGDTLSKLIFQYHDRDLSNWEKLLPLYLSLNSQIKNPDLIYADRTLTVPSQEEVVQYLNSNNDSGFGDANENDISDSDLSTHKRKLSSLIDHVKNPWSLELQVGPYLKYGTNKAADLEYTSKNGFDTRIKGVYYFNDTYSAGVSYRNTKKTYQISKTPIDQFSFKFKEIYLEGYKNWNNFIISTLFGVKDRLVYDRTDSKLLATQHLNYGIGLDYRLIKKHNWEGLVGLSTILFTASTNSEVGGNQKGYDVIARAVFNYNFWPNHLVGIESVYSLSQGKNKLYNIDLEDFITRVNLQINF